MIENKYLKVGTCIVYIQDETTQKNGVIYHINEKETLYSVLWADFFENEEFNLISETYYKVFFQKCELSVYPKFYEFSYLSNIMNLYQDENKYIKFLGTQVNHMWSDDEDDFFTSFVYLKKNNLFIEIAIPDSDIFESYEERIPFVYINESNNILDLHLNKNDHIYTLNNEYLKVENIYEEYAINFSEITQVPDYSELKINGCALCNRNYYNTQLLIFNYTDKNILYTHGLMIKETDFISITYDEFIQKYL